MADSFTLPLRPLVEKRERPDTLPVEIAQINSQWGSFRDVNEDVLRARIEEEKERDGVLEAEEREKNGAEFDMTERLEQLYKRRAEITQFAMQAHMETMFALDFVSLVLSKHAPRQAETSMSAFLKQVAPLGSLDTEVVSPRPKPETASKDVSAVSRGWRIQNFNAAANKLLNAAARLEGEVASETRYWNETLAVKDKGWKVSRLPRERQALGVQYGFLEATPVFRDRGLASLLRAEDGALLLDRGLVASQARFVRVRVKQNGGVSGGSTLTHPGYNIGESIEGRILQARDAVYEEELFHELVREARLMATYGVTLRQDLIRIPAADDLEIVLDLVDATEATFHSGPESSQHDSLLADGLAHSIRLLLAYAHRQNLRRRTQVPPPLTPKKRTTPEYHLLRPALAYLQHMSSVRWLESFLEDIFGVLRSAGLETSGYNADVFETWKRPHASRSAPVEAVIEQFLTPIESTFTGKLLTPQSSFTITVRTSLSSPPFGTNFDVSFDFSKYPDLKSPGRLGVEDEVQVALTHLLLLDIVSMISSDDLFALTADGKDPKDTRRWEAVYPHLGELLLSSSNPEKHQKMKVTISRQGLSVETYLVRNIDGIGRGAWELRSTHPQAKTWKSPSSTDKQAEQPSLIEFVSAETSAPADER
ncbi:Mediator complex subunit Med17 [Penicillium alfredii]|uniref:Mediator of RNA polymerase II transcription subunit 17 n=1 Tax=Penicillium alfredii TaxID=1506179 RepID=A0A9W9FJ80_9EURO|nr:Mediator complex subunit Med17 [Penicillium alfredii]KAJ5101241.1 Mediator complex subunit Med17 [Penicillium alfredii]